MLSTALFIGSGLFFSVEDLSSPLLMDKTGSAKQRPLTDAVLRRSRSTEFLSRSMPRDPDKDTDTAEKKQELTRKVC